MANGTLKVGTITTSSGSGNITIGSGVVVNVNRPSFSAEGSGLTVANSTWTELVGATENFDTDSAYSTSTGRFTVPTGQAGKYYFYYGSGISGNPDDGEKVSVRLYKNSLILRLSMCEKPFVHKYAFSDVKTNFMFHEEFIKILPLLVTKKGIINVGGKSQSVYSFAKKNNPKIIKSKVIKKLKLPLNQTMDLTKLNKIIKKRI